MPVIKSPSSYFEGEIEIDDQLGYPQLAAYERCVLAAGKLIATNETAGFAELRLLMIPGILACVKSWRLAHVPEKPTLETFPSTPREAAGDLYEWIVKSIREVINGENSGPN